MSVLARDRGRQQLLGLVIASVVLLLGASSAQAAVTHAAITSPTSPFIPAPFNGNTGATNQTYTVSGTSDGTSGDAIDVICVYGNTNGNNYSNTWISNIPVNADGTWSSSPTDTANITGQNNSSDSCNLVAQPHGHGGSPADFTAFPPVPTFADWFVDTTVPSGATHNAGTQYDYEFDSLQSGSENYMYSAGSCPMDMYPLDPATLAYFYDVWDCAGGLFHSEHGLNPDRAELQVNGQNVYFPADAYNLYGSGSNKAGQKAAGLTAVSETHSTDAQNNLTLNDNEDAVMCPGTSPGNYPPTSSNCSSFSPAGIHWHSTDVTSQGGQVIAHTVTLSNTSGATETIDARFDQDTDSNHQPSWQFPGSGSNAYNAGQVLNGFSGTGTVAVRLDNRYPDGSYYNPGGTVSYDTPPDRVIFSHSWRPLFDYTRTIPAGGSVTWRFVYTVAKTAADAMPLGLKAEDAWNTPTVSISAPANGATMTAGTQTAVTGHAADHIDAALTINGEPVGVAPDGSFTFPYTVKLGANPITAVVTNLAGNTASAAINVTGTPSPTVTPPPPRCLVPTLRKLTLAQARTALARAHCRLGLVHKARSKKVKKGRVISSSPAAGRALAANSPVTVVQSSGKPKHKKSKKSKKKK